MKSDKIILFLLSLFLLQLNAALSDEGRRKRYLTMFEESGIGTDQVELVGYLARREDHLAMYSRIDIGLDSFPYNGTTTTCEAMWMGVPVLTLAGKSHAGLVGKSLLQCVGLHDFVATTKDEYVAIATRYAHKTETLAEIRASLRESMVSSPLCDAAGFARKMEQAYRKMWSEWCSSV